jgi:hypothetical protein
VQVPQPAPAASIAISPIRALPGAQVLVAGTGFQAGELVLLTFNSVLVQHVTASGSGSFTNGTFIVPNTLGAGQYKVLVVGATSGRGASAVLTVSAVPAVVTPKLYVNPSTVAPGGHATLSGSGFAPGEQIVMRLDTSLIGSVTADGAGSFSTSRTINASLGNHTLIVTGSTSRRVASTTVHLVRPVTAGTSLSPSTAHRGNVVKVSGTNFVSGELVLIRFGSTLVQAKTADQNGRFSNVAITVPGSAPYGVTYISATGSRSGRSAKAALHVTQSPPAGAHLKLSATSLHRGSTVSLSGSGYQGGEIVLIRYRGALVQGVDADSKGNFAKASFQIPVNSPYGTFPVSATGARSGRSAAVQVRVTATASVGIVVTPNVVKQNGSVTVSGHGFAARETILLGLNGQLVQAVVADGNGNFAHAGFQIPTRIHKAKRRWWRPVPRVVDTVRPLFSCSSCGPLITRIGRCPQRKQRPILICRVHAVEHESALLGTARFEARERQDRPAVVPAAVRRQTGMCGISTPGIASSGDKSLSTVSPRGTCCFSLRQRFARIGFCGLMRRTRRTSSAICRPTFPIRPPPGSRSLIGQVASVAACRSIAGVSCPFT